MSAVEHPAPPARPKGSGFWTLDRVAQALADHAAGPLPHGDIPFAGVSTDTRAIRPGDIFVALQGERFDAHDFLAQAVEKGAGALVVSRPEKAVGLSVPVIAVPTSVGYGAAFAGVAPLLTMLNACAANVVVVNIDAGFKAGYVAALIARRSVSGDRTS